MKKMPKMPMKGHMMPDGSMMKGKMTEAMEPKAMRMKEKAMMPPPKAGKGPPKGMPKMPFGGKQAAPYGKASKGKK